MTIFLSTRGLSAHLDDIIRNASSDIFLMTPYLHIADTYYERLEYAIFQ
ncbi:MAG: hypothetical protein H6573_33545 [Lewinellaceae bacterium]|nr:hypothetical protein [Phaeodactylibacter sp.]MCB9352376.1 hypothetical protein [Lewinellaceae bacterium]